MKKGIRRTRDRGDENPRGEKGFEIAGSQRSLEKQSVSSRNEDGEGLCAATLLYTTD